MVRLYIKRTMRELRVRVEKKKEIARDLEEIFRSAQEHGETEEDVIGRLGSPKQYAEQINEQLGVLAKSKGDRKKAISLILIASGMMLIYISCLVSVVGTMKSRIGITMNGKASVCWMIGGVLVLVVGAVVFWRHRRGVKQMEN